MIYEIERYYMGKFNELETFTNIVGYFSNFSKYFEGEVYIPKKGFKGVKKINGEINNEDPVKFINEKIDYLIDNAMFLNGIKLFLYKDKTERKTSFLLQFDGFTNTFLDLTDEEFKSFQIFLKENSLPEDLFCREDQEITPKLKGIWKILGITGRRTYTPLEYKEIFKKK
jgi:hypothetical protein